MQDYSGTNMKPVFRLFLILLLVLTGQTLAAARGQAQIAGEMVLCAGEFTTVVTVDAQGNPVKRVTLCPDMAPSLMNAVAIASPFQPPAAMVRAFVAGRTVTATHEGESISPQARDPPFWA